MPKFLTYASVAEELNTTDIKVRAAVKRIRAAGRTIGNSFEGATGKRGRKPTVFNTNEIRSIRKALKPV